MKHYSAILTVLLLVLCGCWVEAAGMKYVAAGTYIDSTGTQHPWKIDENHNLAWDGQAYVPYGCIFTPTSLAPDASPEAYDNDTKVLQSMLTNNISDVILKPPLPITMVDPAKLQKILDYLETCGVLYGLDLADGPKQALKGYIIKPSIYRIEGPSDETTIVRNWPGVDSAIYIVLNRQSMEIEERGGAVISDGKITIKLANPIGPGRIFMVFPRTVYPAVEKGGYGDPWAGYGEYRDRVITYFKNVKLGKGLRFVLNPLLINVDYTGQLSTFVPDSGGFRIGFESYLTKRHISETTLNSVWSIGKGVVSTDEKVTLSDLGTRPTLDSLETAARMIPMWGAGRGAPYLYDKANGKFYTADTASSQIWFDLIAYRQNSTQEFMNTISDLIKTNIANVPVIFNSSSLDTNYMNPFAMSGFDGLAARTIGTGEAGAVAAGPVYAMCEESPRTQWFITVTAPQRNVEYADETSLVAALDSFQSLGAKGFYLDWDLVAGNASPSQLTNLGKFKQKYKPDELARYKPEIVSYPINPQVGGYTTRLAPGVWWLPSGKQGKTTYIGDGLVAYTFKGEDRSYIWALEGTKTITTKLSQSQNPGIIFPKGSSVSKKKDNYSFKVSDVPTVVSGSDFLTLFPFETAKEEIDRLVKLIGRAEEQKIDTRMAKESVKTANNVYKNGQANISFQMAHTAWQTLANQVGADIWIEGERCDVYSFDGMMSRKGASGGLVLSVDTSDDPPLTPYTATFNFNSKNDSSYELWLAATPPEEGSPVMFSIDGAARTPVTAIDQSLTPYAPGLAWYKVGVVNTFAGQHSISFTLSDRRASDQKYFFDIDSVILSPSGFKPNGLNRP